MHVLELHYNGGQTLRGCEANLRSERRAYRVQNAYLRGQGRRERHGRLLAGLVCAPQQPDEGSMILVPAQTAYRERMVLEDFMAELEAEGGSGKSAATPAYHPASP